MPGCKNPSNNKFSFRVKKTKFVNHFLIVYCNVTNIIFPLLCIGKSAENMMAALAKIDVIKIIL